MAQAKAQAVWTARLSDYSLFIAAKLGVKNFLLQAIEDTWVVELKVSNTLYTKVTAKAIIDQKVSCRGLHSFNVLAV